MSFRSSLCEYIETKTAITNLIGTQFYPQIAKSATLPYAVFRRTSQLRYPASSGSTAIVTTNLRIVSFGETYDEAESVSDQFRIALDGKRGSVGSDQFFSSCQLVEESDDIDPVEFAQNSAPHFVAQTYSITHRESAPTL